MLVVNTIVAVGPLTFLSLSEAENGQIDAVFFPGAESISYANYESHGLFSNYTNANELYGNEDNFAPRKQMSQSFI